MKKTAKILFVLVAFLLAWVNLVGHPHFNKTLTVKVGNVEAKLAYFTAPANEEHVQNAPVGEYIKSFATLSLSADVTVGEITLKAGDYNIGAFKNNEAGSDFTLALHEGKLGFQDSPDAAKVIKLPSMFSKENGKAEHMTFDIAPGFGNFEGKAVLIWHFGSYFLAGQIGG